MGNAIDRYNAWKSSGQYNAIPTSIEPTTPVQDADTSKETYATNSSTGGSAIQRYQAWKASQQLDVNNPSTSPNNPSVFENLAQNYNSATDILGDIPFIGTILKAPYTFTEQSLGMLGGLTNLAFKGVQRGIYDIAHPIKGGLSDIQEGARQVGDLGSNIAKGVTDPKGPISTFTDPIGSTTKAWDSFLKLQNLPEGEARKAVNNIQQAYLQDEDLSPLTKIIGGAGMGIAETLTKLGTDPKVTIQEDPLETTLNLLSIRDFASPALKIANETKGVVGLKNILKSSANELTEPAVKAIQNGRLGKVIDGMQDYLKVKALKKDYDAFTYKRMDEWFESRNELVAANYKHFEETLTKQEKKMFPYYAKGLAKVPENASPDLKLALTKAQEIARLDGEALVRQGVLPAKTLELRKWGPIKSRIAYTQYGKFLDQLTPEESSVVDKLMQTAQEGIHPFYYPAIQKNRFLGYMFPSKAPTRARPGFSKMFTGRSEANPESFFQSPFQVMTRSQLAVQKYLYDIETMNSTLQKFAKPVRLGDDVLPGYEIIAPEGYTALIDPTKTSGEILESILTDPNVDFNNALFGNSVEEVAQKLGVNLADAATQTRPINFYQIPRSIGRDIRKRISGSAFRQELRSAQNMGEVFDAIWGNKGEAFLGKQGLRGAALRLWKKVVLGYYPLRWMKNNLVGNVVFSLMQGLTPKDFIESLKMTRGKGVYKNLLEATNPESIGPLALDEIAQLPAELQPLLKNVNRYKNANSFIEKARTILPDQTNEQLLQLYRRFKAYRPDLEEVQALPKFERAGVVGEELKQGLAKVLGIEENQLKRFLPQGVESGMASTELNRVLDNFYSIEDDTPMMQKGFDVFKRAFNYIPKKTFAANSKLENFYRRASYYHAASRLAKDALRKSGKRVNAKGILDQIVSDGDIQASALKEVNQFFGDYLNKVPGDQAIPFIRFYKHVLDLAVKYPVQHPERALLLQQALDTRDAMDENIRRTESLPDYLQEENNIPVEFNGKKFRMRIDSSDPFGALDFSDVKALPFTGFQPLDLVATSLLRQAAPDVKIGAERISGYDLFKQKPFVPSYIDTDQRVPELNEHILKQWPILTDARKLSDAINYWKKTGKFEVPARDSMGKVYVDANGDPMYTSKESLELLKTIGINLVPEELYQEQVDKAITDEHDEQIEKQKKQIIQ